jgi:hypothetical protein
VKGARFFIATGIGALMLGALVGPAVAQRTGSRIGRDIGPKDGPLALRVMTECFVDIRNGMSRRWLDTTPGAAEGKLVKAENQSMSDCMRGDKLVMDGRELRFPVDAMRRELAVAMVRQMMRHHGAALVAPAADTKPWYLTLLASMPKDTPVDRKALGFEDFGHCIAMRQWDDSLALVRTEEGSDAEKAAFHALIPALAPCLTADQTTHINVTMVREAVAEPIYHIVAARGTSGTP